MGLVVLAPSLIHERQSSLLWPTWPPPPPAGGGGFHHLRVSSGLRGTSHLFWWAFSSATPAIAALLPTLPQPGAAWCLKGAEGYLCLLLCSRTGGSAVPCLLHLPGVQHHATSHPLCPFRRQAGLGPSPPPCVFGKCLLDKHPQQMGQMLLLLILQSAFPALPASPSLC